jgi:hypothetical protein
MLISYLAGKCLMLFTQGMSCKSGSEQIMDKIRHVSKCFQQKLIRTSK